MSSEDLVREAQDPATPAARLAELAQADRATWPAIVFHPNAYDGLLQWLGERGDPTVGAALAARASHAATLQSAAPTAAAPVEPAPTAPVAATPVEPEPVAPASPVAEPVVPVAGPADVRAAEPASPVAEPTVVIPAEEPAPAQAAASEPTSVFPAQPAYPAAQPAYPAAQPLYAEAQPAQTSAFGAVPPGGGGQPPAGTGGGAGKKSLPVAAVVALTVLVVLLIGGAAFGATKVFGGDDDNDPKISAGDNKTTDAPDADDETDEPSDPTPTPSPTTETPGGSASSGEFCTELADIQTKSLEAFSGGSTPDLSKIQDTARELVEAYDDLGDIAPPEVKSDIEVMSKFLNSMMNPTGDAPTGMDEYIGAAQRIGTYYAQNCL